MPSVEERLRYWRKRAENAEATLWFTIPALQVLRTMLAKAGLNRGAMKADEVLHEVKNTLGVKETDEGIKPR